MREITQIRKLSLWVFIVPFLSINLCLLISVNFHLLEETIFAVDQIGRSDFTFPYFDGSLSISRASRTFPQYLIFKPAMILTSVILILYWSKTNNLLKSLLKIDQNFLFRICGIMSAIFLSIHSIFLGIEFDLKTIEFLKRFFLLGFILSEIAAQALLVFKLIKYKDKITDYFNPVVLKLKLFLITFLIIIAIIAIPFLNNENYTHLKHGLEWNYFIGIIFFYFLTFLYWKENLTQRFGSN